MSFDPDVWQIRDAAALGRAIADQRRRMGITQAELADLTGISRPYLSKLEQGHTTEQTERLFRLFRQVGLKVSVTASQIDQS